MANDLNNSEASILERKNSCIKSVVKQAIDILRDFCAECGLAMLLAFCSNWSSYVVVFF